MSAAEPPRDHDTRRLGPILAMLELLEPLPLAELERALRLRLDPVPTAAERRVAELGYLALLLAELPQPEPEGLTPRLDRAVYDARQPLDAPTAPCSRRLVERYDSWLSACRAAYGLLPDGRKRGAALPWRCHTRGEARTSAYSRDEVRAALKQCALAIGRQPSAQIYQQWSNEQKRVARSAGAAIPRLPSLRVIYRHYPKSENRWRLALTDAAIGDGELAIARIERVLRLAHIDVLPAAPLQLLKQANPCKLAAHGIDDKRRQLLLRRGFGSLTLIEATTLARVLGGSLDWLSGIGTEPEGPPAFDVAFDPDAMRALQRQRRINDEDLLIKLDIALGPWRQLKNGKREPLLYELAALTVALQTRIQDLLKKPAAEDQ